MASSWIEFFKDESLTLGSSTNKLANQSFSHYSKQLSYGKELDDDKQLRIGKFHSDILETGGNNILLIQTAGKQVQVLHSVRIAPHPETNKNFAFGIQGLDKYSPVLQIHERSIVKTLGPGKEGVTTREGSSSVYPSPEDFASVNSTSDFKSLEGSLSISEEARINTLPNFSFIHPYLLVHTFHGPLMTAADLGYQIIQTGTTAYGKKDAPNPKTGLTQGLSDCYDILLFLWGIEKGFGSVAKTTIFPHSNVINSFIDTRVKELEDWQKRKIKDKGEKEVKTYTNNKSSKKKLRYHPSDEDDILDAETLRTHFDLESNKDNLPTVDPRTGSTGSEDQIPTSRSKNDKAHQDKPPEPDVVVRRPELIGKEASRTRDPNKSRDLRSNTPPPREKKKTHTSTSGRGGRSHRSRSRSPPSERRGRRRSRSHEGPETRAHRRSSRRGRNDSPHRSRNHEQLEIRRTRINSSPRPRSRERPRDSRRSTPSPSRSRSRSRSRDRQHPGGHRTAGQGGGDFYDDDDDDDDSSSDNDSRKGGGRNRRGDDRDPHRGRRRSPSDDSRGGRSPEDPRRSKSHEGDGRGGRRGSRNSRSRSRSRSRDRRRGENRHGRRRSGGRSPAADMEAIMIQGMAAILTSQKEALLDQREAKKKEEIKKSMLSKLYAGAADNFKYLTARHWKDSNLRLNPFMSRVMEDKDLSKSLGYFTAMTQDWPGQISRKGLTEFITQGFRAYDINRSPGGFTVFMCYPSSTKPDRTEEERRLAIRSAYGEVKLDDATIKMYTKRELYIPENIYEVEEQLETCVCLLELVTERGGIASEGFLHGLRYFRKHRAMFMQALLSDPLLLTRYLYMLDRVFQQFVKDLEEYYHRSDPLRAARSKLEGSMVRAIDSMMMGFEYGSIPQLTLPHSLSTSQNTDPQADHQNKGNRSDRGRGKGGPDKDNRALKKQDSGNPPWWGTNDNVQDAWKLPSGRSYKDFFSSIVESHKENIKGWPKLPHHSMERSKPMCIRYQCAGKCSERCMMAHVNPKDIGPEDYEAITKKFKQVFSSYAKSFIVPEIDRTDSGQQVNPFEIAEEEKHRPQIHHLINPFLESDTDESETDRQVRNQTPKTKGPRPKEERVTRPSKRKANPPRAYHLSKIGGDERKARNDNSRKRKDDIDYDERVLGHSDGSDSSVEDLEIPIGASKKERLASSRNAGRVRKRNKQDKQTISKYLPSDIEDIFFGKITGADDHFIPPDWLLKSIREVAAMPVTTPKSSEIIFDTSPEALDHNTALLEKYDFDFESFLASQTGSTLDYGSEFRPIDQLKRVLGNHPNFPFFEDILENGMKYHFKKPLTEEERMEELSQQIARGNHKSAQDEADVAIKLLHKDVTHGFAFPVKAQAAIRIKGAMVEPCGVTNQFKLQADGSRKLAARLTHDLSHSITSDDAAVNKRIDMEQYTEMVYGWCLSRTIHFIVALRLAHPGKRIFIAKYDYSDAYRRVAHAASAAVQTILIVSNIAYIMLRLAFGGSPNPPTWCAFSEMVTDLSNEIDLCKDWDPSELRSPAQPETPIPECMSDDVPFAIAKPLAVDVPVSCTARTDSFIDDLIRVFLDTLMNRERSPHAVPLAIHVTSRPHAGDDEPITRRGLLSASKLEAEGLPVELQIVLGWDIDTRRLLILLPQDKFIAWSCDLEEIVRRKTVSMGDLDSLVGRLNHVAFLIPLARHFLHRFRMKLQKRYNDRQILTLSKEEVEDLLLWGDYLLRARQGISLNRLTIRHPDRLGFGDSCPVGLGGYSFHGWAWRLTIPQQSPIYGVAEVNNVLEFLALAINIWVIILECKRDSVEEACILALGDNTSALGWLYKIRFFSKDSFYYTSVNMIARKIARLVIASSHCLASQHLRGELNVVADLLSFAETRTDAKPHPIAFDSPNDKLLTQRFHAHYSQYIPKSFEISRLPNEILSFATLVLQTLELSFIQSKSRRMKTETESGDGGNLTATDWVSPITTSSLSYPQEKKSSSQDPSSHCIVTPNGINQDAMLSNIQKQWRQALSEMPQAIWLRRFGTVSNQAPFTSKGERGYYQTSNPS